jgi:hypothetical protein
MIIAQKFENKENKALNRELLEQFNPKVVHIKKEFPVTNAVSD